MSPATRRSVSSKLLDREYASADLVAFLRDTLMAQEISSPWNRLAYMEIKTTMADDFLNYVDRMGMAHSMELRVPFLDHELVEFAARLPFELKVKGFRTKHILKRVATPLLSERIVHRKKQPFFLPLSNWIRNDLRGYVSSVLSEEKLTEQGYFDSAGVRSLLQEHMSGEADHGWSIWALLIFQVWHDRFIESADVTTHHTLCT